ncbi:MAG: hypothetical protein HQK54_02760 [Oligoflexales bacterium]|nr:hypothetical protein [Oligoflexales bacterium]
MHVIWKRPDGFHDASPKDYFTVELDGDARIWLHNEDKDQYPFRISGGWEEKELAVKLNNLINLLPNSTETWVKHLTKDYNQTLKDSPQEYFDSICSWLKDLKNYIKGDTWEVEIITRAIDTTLRRLIDSRDLFIKSVS